MPNIKSVRKLSVRGWAAIAFRIINYCTHRLSHIHTPDTQKLVCVCVCVYIYWTMGDPTIEHHVTPAQASVSLQPSPPPTLADLAAWEQINPPPHSPSSSSSSPPHTVYRQMETRRRLATPDRNSFTNKLERKKRCPEFGPSKIGWESLE